MRRSGVITSRRRMRERGKRLRRRAMLAGLVLLLCALAMSDQLKGRIAGLMEQGIDAVHTFADAGTKSIDVFLEEKEVYALQLGVFESEEHALTEQKRLEDEGVPCAVWKRDKLRLICDIAADKERLNSNAAGGNEAYIVRDTLEEVQLRLSGSPDECEAAAAFAALPDTLLDELLSQDARPMEEILIDTQWLAQNAIEAHPENELYCSLAQALLAWCEAVSAEKQETAKCYAALALCSVCREWRSALLT